MTLFSASAATNVWLGSLSSEWGNASNWALGLPSTNDWILIDGYSLSNYAPTISGGTPGTSLTVSNLEVVFAALDTSGFGLGGDVPLHLLGSVLLESGSGLQIFGPLHPLSVEGLTRIGIPENNPHGSVIAVLRLYDGTNKLNDLIVGGATNYLGLLDIRGGTLEVSGAMNVAVNNSPALGGEVNQHDGLMIVTNKPVILGTNGGNGAFIQSAADITNNPTAITRAVLVGNDDGSLGALSVDGTFIATEFLRIGNNVALAPGTPAQCSATVGKFRYLYVTNATHTAYIDIVRNGELMLSSNAFLYVDQLILTNGGNFVNNFGSVFYSDQFRLENGSTITVTNANLNASTNFIVGSQAGSTGSVFVTGGTLSATNGLFSLGNAGTLSSGSGTGTATVTNGTLQVQSLLLGSTAGGSGTLTVQSNAVVTVNSNVSVVSGSLFSTSSVVVANGALMATNGLVQIGSSGSGLLELSGGLTTIKQLKLGGTNGVSSGTLRLSTGAVLRVLERASANYILLGGGDLDGGGGTIVIGEDHDAAVDITSHSATNIGSMYVGFTPGFTGQLNQSGGVIGVLNNFIVGDCVSGAIGRVTLTAGVLFVTNAAHNAVLDVRNGSFILGSNATLVADILVLTNACGQFVRNGGTLLVSSNIFHPQLDADGDGQSNDAEMRAGTDPLNPDSTFKVIGTKIVNGHDVRVDWTTVPGHSYVVQTSTSLVGGQFQDLSPVIFASGAIEGITNYVHLGGATNRVQSYRVRLVQ